MNTETSVKHMIVVKGLSKSFDDVPVLQNLDATLNKGEIVSIVGPSGTGKSTFLRCLNLLEIPDEGTTSNENGNGFSTIQPFSTSFCSREYHARADFPSQTF